MSMGTGDNKKIRVYLRTGFIRMCIENEYDIIPTLAPNEEVLLEPLFVDYYKVRHRMWKMLGIVIPIHIAHSLPFIPRRVENNMIFYGNKIRCKKSDDIYKIFDTYVDELKRLSLESGCEIDFYNLEEINSTRKLT
jgi:hypothetical protein